MEEKLVNISENKMLFNSSKDILFLKDKNYPTSFKFNDDVANVFDDMVLRSIPLYKEVLENVVYFVKEFFKEGTKIFDIGCSTGTTIAAICEHITNRAHFVAIDNSCAMLDKAKKKLIHYQSQHKIEFVCNDALNIEYTNGSVVILNYTLQFISVCKRKNLLQKIYDGLIDDGLLYLSDKILSKSIKIQNLIHTMYENFKLKNGYSKKEIARKKEALENVLVPLCLEDEINLIKSVGFKHVEPIMKWNNFVSIIALK